MKITVFKTAEDAASAAAEAVAKRVQDRPNLVVGLPTGSTPILLYRELVRLHRAGRIDFSRVTTFNIDEYEGLSPEHPQSFHRFMRDHLFDHINIHKERAHIPDGMTRDIPGFCKRYETEIRGAGGLDLQVLGVGLNGHIGFNEPGASRTSVTRRVALTEKTRADNARFFVSESAVPRHAITMGIETFMAARECFLLAFGTAKARIIAEAIEGPLTMENPASVLQEHPSVQIFLDSGAASRLGGAWMPSG